MFENNKSINKSFVLNKDEDIDDFCFDFDIVAEPQAQSKKQQLDDISTDEEHNDNQITKEKFDMIEKIVDNKKKVYKALRQPALNALKKKLNF